MAFGGLLIGTLNPILSTVVFERVPQQLRTRVQGIITAGCQLTMPLGGLTAGFLVEGTSLRTALLLVGGLYFVATLSPLVFPSWRTMDDVPPETTPGMAPEGAAGAMPLRAPGATSRTGGTFGHIPALTSAIL
ncbi:MFS transporter [Streptomyces spiroverticillatus]